MFGWHISVDPNWREFKHPLFKKGHIELLPLIKRKNGTKTKSEKRERSRSDGCFLSVVSDSTDHALSMSVKKSKLDRDLYLRELSLLKKQISDMESKYNNILQENRFLWKTFMNSKKQQDIMKQQMERICKFINKFSAGNRLLETDDTPQYVCFCPLSYADAAGPTSWRSANGSRPIDSRRWNPHSRTVQRHFGVSIDRPSIPSYLQINSVPRLDSPRVRLRSSVEYPRPVLNQRMLTNISHDPMSVSISLVSHIATVHHSSQCITLDGSRL